MPRQIWEKEERIEYRKLFREYKREGYEPEEAKYYLNCIVFIR